MAKKVTVPKLGMGTAPITLVEWCAKEGEWVEKGKVVLIVETEKIRHDVPAKAAGFLHILIKEGSDAPISSAAGLLAETKEELATLQKEEPSAATVSSQKPAETSRTAPTVETKVRREGRVIISPAARKLAEEHMIDLSVVEGTGPGGRIVREDVEQAIAGGAPAAVQEYDGREVEQTIPLRGTRQAIAEHMVRSLTISAQLTAMGEIDAGELVKLHKKLKNESESTGKRISYTAIIIAAVARALRANPMVNASIIDNDIKVWKSINIGAAVPVEGGLIVPVIKDADKKSLVEISENLRELTEKARNRALTDKDVRGGTFTVSNVGPLGAGYRFDTDIINQPESAILGVGGITDRPAVRDGQIVIRPIMSYSLTYDHRLVDGAMATQFMASLIEELDKAEA
jgi:pyruvate dehydrogenase E2 component (dihydrolipoamide acetyltransferase)